MFRALMILGLILTVGCDMFRTHSGSRSSICEPLTVTIANTFNVDEGSGPLPTWGELSIFVDSQGNLFAGGSYDPGIWKAFIRKRTPDGTWTTPLTYQFPGSHTAARGGFVEDLSGNLYTILANVGSGAAKIFKSTDHGDNWIDMGTVTHPAAAGGSTLLFTITKDSQGRIYIGGMVDIASGGKFSMFVMRSTDGATTWTLQSTYLPNVADTMFKPKNLQFVGNDLFVSGDYEDASAEQHQMYLKSTDAGVTWTTLYDFQASPVAFLFGNYRQYDGVVYLNTSIFQNSTAFIAQILGSSVGSLTFSNAAPGFTIDPAGGTFAFDDVLKDATGAVIAGYAGTDSGGVWYSKIMRTENHGTTWNEVWTSPSGTYLSQGAYDQTTGNLWYSGSDNSSPSNMVVYKQSCY